jgi:hypothetical protein
VFQKISKGDPTMRRTLIVLLAAGLLAAAVSLAAGAQPAAADGGRATLEQFVHDPLGWIAGWVAELLANDGTDRDAPPATAADDPTDDPTDNGPSLDPNG